MGRKKKYETTEERDEAIRANKRRWYIRNRVEQQQKMLNRYHANKNNSGVAPTEELPEDEDVTYVMYEDMEPEW